MKSRHKGGTAGYQLPFFLLKGFLGEHQDIGVEPGRGASAEQVRRTIDVRGSFGIAIQDRMAFEGLSIVGFQCGDSCRAARASLLQCLEAGRVSLAS